MTRTQRIAQALLVLALAASLVFLAVSRRELNACEIQQRETTRQLQSQRQSFDQHLMAERQRVAELERSVIAIGSEVERLQRGAHGPSGTIDGNTPSRPSDP